MLGREIAPDVPGALRGRDLLPRAEEGGNGRPAGGCARSRGPPAVPLARALSPARGEELIHLEVRPSSLFPEFPELREISVPRFKDISTPCEATSTTGTNKLGAWSIFRNVRTLEGFSAPQFKDLPTGVTLP